MGANISGNNNNKTSHGVFQQILSCHKFLKQFYSKNYDSAKVDYSSIIIIYYPSKHQIRNSILMRLSVSLNIWFIQHHIFKIFFLLIRCAFFIKKHNDLTIKYDSERLIVFNNWNKIGEQFIDKYVPKK